MSNDDPPRSKGQVYKVIRRVTIRATLMDHTDEDGSATDEALACALAALDTRGSAAIIEQRVVRFVWHGPVRPVGH